MPYATGGQDCDRTTTRRAAFFDLDNTLIPGSSLYLLARGLHEREVCGTQDILRFAYQQAVFRLARVERSAALKTSREAALEIVQGRYRPDMQAIAEGISDQRILPRVYPEIAELIRGHGQVGDLTFIATAAPAELAQILAQRLGMTGGLGTSAEVDGAQRYSGRLGGSVLHGVAKAEAVAAHAERTGIDLSVSVAYSDSISDLPLLELVGRAEVVNPDRKLRQVADARGWPVREVRTVRTKNHPRRPTAA